MDNQANHLEAVSKILVEVAYAQPDKQAIIPVTVPAGATLLDAAVASGIVDQFPEIDLDTAKMGMFGTAVAKPHEQPLKEGDRVEIYRPLIADPKEVRKRRAERAQQSKVVNKLVNKVVKE
ncbi:MAG: RnfH family protein [Endozoicomonadaceae bacterium]|nr:RnfH family protein [Endozoicomonadaceae bacterium]